MWWRYVVTVTGDASQKDIARATGIDKSSISRWLRGTNTPRAEAVVALARAYARSLVEALFAAGYLSSSDLGVLEPGHRGLTVAFIDLPPDMGTGQASDSKQSGEITE